MVSNFFAAMFDVVIKQIKQILDDIEIASPDGRWEMLQRWLKEYPQIREWAYLPTDDAFVALRNAAIDKALAQVKIPAVIFRDPVAQMISDVGETRIKSTISTLQALYRERAGETEKEIKNVSRPKSKSRSGSRKRANKPDQFR